MYLNDSLTVVNIQKLRFSFISTNQREEREKAEPKEISRKYRGNIKINTNSRDGDNLYFGE